VSTTGNKGNRAEQHALNYLSGQGLKIVERNFHSLRGEIDLVMLDAGTLVFVEVRLRNSDQFGSAAESVNHKKQLRIIHAANRYLQIRPQWANSPCRFDVVAINGRPNGRVDWIKDAFQPNQ